jgi:general secretion pathway protein B
MSLILEALRKSEAERRRAQLPDLLAEPQAASVPMPVASQRWPWLVLGAGVLLCASWLVRALLATGATSSDATVGNRNIDPAEAPTPAQPTPVRAAPPLRRPLVVAPSVAMTAPSTPTAASPAAPRASNGNVASAVVAAPTPDAGVAQAAARPVTSPPAVQPQPRSTDTILRLTDLGSDERSQLPPLKLSMHMWNDIPAQRFVIIDGNRLGIGARIGTLTVADIVSDGVVLDWNGRLLKLPLR